MIRRVTVKKYTRELLRVYADDDESVDDAVNRLLDSVGDSLVDDSLFHVGHTSIDLDVDTIERLESCRLYDNEPYNSVLFRAVMLWDKR